MQTTTPVKDAPGVAPNTIIAAELVDGGTPINTATVKLSLDGNALTNTATKSGNVTSISYQPTRPFAAGSSTQLL